MIQLNINVNQVLLHWVWKIKCCFIYVLIGITNDLPQLKHHSPQVLQFDSDLQQLNNDLQYFCYDYILIILILTIVMIKYDIFITC